VTLVENGKQLMRREDADVAAEMSRVLSGEGIDILLGAETHRVQEQSGKQVGISVRTAAGEQTIEGSDTLVAVGRIPNIADISPKASAGCWRICRHGRRRSEPAARARAIGQWPRLDIQRS
jgi:pyruvate/2-oxoglutarate dehydrogenase complex dihydrolipoamide dehydrogenase (E3) component